MYNKYNIIRKEMNLNIYTYTNIMYNTQGTILIRKEMNSEL